MAIGNIGGYGNINTYSYQPRTSTKKTDDTQSTDKTSQTPVRTKSAWAEEQEKKVTSKKDATQSADDQELYAKGRTIGKPTLSKKAQDYYEKLQKKFGNMQFILVSEDQKQSAEANAASYASKNKTTVLINEDKIEEMANDENVAKKYEGIIENSARKLPDLKKQLEQAVGTGNLKGIGMQVNDNGAVSFFATVRDQAAASNEALKKRQAARKAAKKAADKQAAKKADQEKKADALKEKAADKSSDTDTTKKTDDSSDDDDYKYIEKDPDSDETGEVTPWDMYGTKTIYASSVDDLIKAVKSFQTGSSAYSSGNSINYEG